MDSSFQFYYSEIMDSYTKKTSGLLLLVLIIFYSCKKTESSDRDYLEYTFDKEGKDFSFKQSKVVNTTPPQTKYVQLSIPANAVNERNSIECYAIYCDTAEIHDYYVDWWVGDVNLFCCSATTLNKTATIKLPMPYNNYTASNLYKPYKITLEKNENAATAMNTPSKVTPITNFTWDNIGRYIIIETTDLNAAYVIARPK
ncbi:MAG: hypothetical protein IAF38_19975 [Bacteroidia bacterium]|nr:hypothetical protein [Bacteroidia bacterium]